MQQLRNAAFIALLAALSILTAASSAQARYWTSSGGYPGPAYYGFGPGYSSYGSASLPYENYRRLSSTPFDGNWSAVAQTTRGHCENIQFGLAISGGRIYSAGGSYGGYPAQLGGRVLPSGQVRVNAMAGPRMAQGTGRLGPYQGGGTWVGQGPSGFCSGYWSAYRA